MTNPTGGFGLRPVRRRDGAAWTGALTAVQIAFNNTHVIAKGDPVISLATGFIDLWASGVIRGVFWGCEYLDPVSNYVNWFNAWKAPTLPAGTQVTAYIIDDPDLVFEIRAGSGLQVTQGNVWNNAAIQGMGSPSVAGLSTATLTGIATTASLPLRISGLSQKIGNDNTSPSNIVEAIFNNFELRPGQTGI
ncbi:MAG TPA: hypothetical protein VMA53_04100 [Stellaceae bacterium]|nr:hypothetical protein [Stellaceae bacterium]